MNCGLEEGGRRGETMNDGLKGGGGGVGEEKLGIVDWKGRGRRGETMNCGLEEGGRRGETMNDGLEGGGE